MSATPAWSASQVTERLARLASASDPNAVFRADGHHFVLGPTMSIPEVEQFEAAWNFLLPPSYRAFLTEVGNGGAGPGYGLFALGEVDDPKGDTEPWNEYLVGSVTSPFPHDQAWNLPDDELSPPADLPEDQWDGWFERHDAEYYDPHLMDGAIPVTHLGCAIRVYLVVSGPRAGQVWTDDRASDDGIYPCDPIDFSQWYLTWLDQAERVLGATAV